MSRPVPMSGHENKLIALMPCRVTTDGAYGLWERGEGYHDKYVVGAVNRDARGDGSLWYTGSYFQDRTEAMACLLGRAGYTELSKALTEGKK